MVENRLSEVGAQDKIAAPAANGQGARAVLWGENHASSAQASPSANGANGSEGPPSSSAAPVAGGRGTRGGGARPGVGPRSRRPLRQGQSRRPGQSVHPPGRGAAAGGAGGDHARRRACHSRQDGRAGTGRRRAGGQAGLGVRGGQAGGGRSGPARRRRMETLQGGGPDARISGQLADAGPSRAPRERAPGPAGHDAGLRRDSGRSAAGARAAFAVAIGPCRPKLEGPGPDDAAAAALKSRIHACPRE